MGNSFSFADFIPEPLTYRDEALGGDGSSYDVQVKDLLSTEALVQFMRIEKQVREIDLSDGVGEADTNKIDTLTDQMLAILIPTLPTARRQIIPLSLKMRFITWWREVQETKPGGESDIPNGK